MTSSSFDNETFYESEFDEHRALLDVTRDAVREDFFAMLDAWEETIRGGAKILFFGNGGSAGDAQHLATELAVRYAQDRAPIPAIALTTDSSSLTAIGNDMGFERLFARQVEAIGRPGDLVVGISTSSNSPNVIAGLEAAKKNGLRATGFGGRDGGKMKGLAEPLIIVPSDVTARIQEMHIMLGQMLCGALEIRLGLLD